LFEQHRELFDADSYAVQSAVPLDVFEAFIDSLKTQKKMPATKENVASLWVLAKEFFLSEVVAECANFPVSIDQFSKLSDRVSELERQLSSFSNPPPNIGGQIESQEEELETLHWALEKLRTSLEGELDQVQSLFRDMSSSIHSSGAPAASASLTSSRSRPNTDMVGIPMREDKSLDGIISYLTDQCGGNVVAEEILTITSKSDGNNAPSVIADLNSDSSYWSKCEPESWVCWDFREVLVCPTHYTIQSWGLQSWVVEVSLDGSRWMEIDRRAGSLDFRNAGDLASFAVRRQVECRFIRLTQTDRTWDGLHCLILRAVEFFGTLYEE
jgi:hypothetical protein